MGGRYLVTGVQLGIIKAAMLMPQPRTEKGKEGATKVLYEFIDEILKHQFLGNSDQNINEDVEHLSKYHFEEN